MVQLLRRTPKAPPRKTKGQEFSEALTAGLNYYAQQDAKSKQAAAVKKYLGPGYEDLDFENLGEDTINEIVKNTAKFKARSQYFGGNDPLNQPAPGTFGEQLENAPIDVQTGETPAGENAGETPGQKIKKLENQLENFQYEDEEDQAQPKQARPKPIPMPPRFKPPYSDQQIKKSMGWNIQEGRALQQENADARRAYDAEVKRIQTQNENDLNRYQREVHFNKEYGLKSKKIGMQENEHAQKIKEKKVPLSNALKTVSTMKSLRKNGNLGVFSHAKGIFSPKTRKDRAKYETLGNSLISFAASIPIRNKQEFETLTGMLNDPNITDEAASGVLEAIETIIKGSMKAYEDDEEEISQPSKSVYKRPPLSSFER